MNTTLKTTELDHVVMDYWKKVLHQMVKRQVKRYFKPYIDKAVENAVERISYTIDDAMRVSMFRDAKDNKLIVSCDVKTMPDFYKSITTKEEETE